MGSPGRLALRAWPGGPWFMVGLQPPLSSFVFPPRRTLVLPLKGCALLSFPLELSPPVSWNSPMFVFPVPLNRPKEERKARFCVTATPVRSGPGGAGRAHAPARGCWRRGEIGLDSRVHAPTKGSGSHPSKCPPPPSTARPSLPGWAGGGGGGRHPGGASRSVTAPTRRPGGAARLEPFLPFNPAAWASRGSWPVARLLLRAREGGKKL